MFNKKGQFVPKVFQKDHDIEEALRQKLNESFMFRALEVQDLKIVIDAMQEVQVEKGQIVINQGDDGDVLYFVFQGTLDCYKIFPGDSAPTHLLTYTPGTSFGELALLYNTPRAASIKANEHVILYSLDRECFNNIVKESAIKRREKYDSFLSDVELL
jgi:cAMP-dependent protein kinase regulator